MLEPCCLVPKTLRLGIDNAEPKAGLVARWMRSGGGGERGRPGGLSGMKLGGPMGPVGGGGCLGGGGRTIIGGRDLSTGAERTRARGASSIAAERVDSIDWRRSWWADRVLARMVALGSRSVVSCGAGVGRGEGTEVLGEDSGDTSWNC
jgi:hypothetical protein